MAADIGALKAYLFSHMYRHPRVTQSMERAKQVVADLAAAFRADPSLLPADWAEACAGASEERRVSVVRDYIAGMTDRYALLEHNRIFHTQIVL